ncbi:MAG: type I methionyl aminopeptidase [Chitinophagaceae bacterium]|nr:MAG: type I methionyl aminopeptidase [Chitinophagaceae bacterium]
MSISSQLELNGMKAISEAVGVTLREMRNYAKPGLSTKALDEFGRTMLEKFGAKSAPKLTYGFPGWTCISVNNEVAHGIPSASRILQEGDLVNVDVSAELNGFWSDNGGSFVLGQDINNHLPLVNASKAILQKAIAAVRPGMKIADLGKLIQGEAAKNGYKVIKNLVGHGIGRSLHEAPKEIPCYYDRFNMNKFKKNAVVAIETFISTGSSYAYDKGDGWTFITTDGSYVAQHEHTLVIQDGEAMVLTGSNEIWN